MKFMVFVSILLTLVKTQNISNIYQNLLDTDFSSDYSSYLIQSVNLNSRIQCIGLCNKIENCKYATYNKNRKVDNCNLYDASLSSILTTTSIGSRLMIKEIVMIAITTASQGKPFGSTCSIASECNTNQGLECISGTCNCNNQKWYYRENMCRSCKSGWIFWTNQCYYVNSTMVTQSVAATWCTKNNATLPIISSQDELNYLRSLNSANFFVGATSNGAVFSWADGTSLISSSSYWCSQPNNLSTEFCVLCVASCLNSVNCGSASGIMMCEENW